MKMWRSLAFFSVLALMLAGCGKEFQSTLIPKGEVAKMQYDLIMLSIIVMVLVVVVVTILFLIVIVKFRRKKGDENFIPKQVEGNHTLEIIWTVIPIILLIILAVPTVTMTFKLADVKEMNKKDTDALVVDVTAKLYWWEFNYKGEEVMTAQDLVIPVGEKVYLNLKGGDIKHSFWVPSLGGKMDTNTDNVNQMYLIADEPGVYNGFCTEFCGPSHSLMQFKVKALSKEDYTAWLADMKNAKSTATTDLAKQGEEIFQKSCIGCHAVEVKDPRPDKARLAPNLTNFAERDMVAGIADLTKENVHAWLKDPAAMKPENKMTGTYGNLSDQELDALTEYLMGLKSN